MSRIWRFYTRNFKRKIYIPFLISCFFLFICVNQMSKQLPKNVGQEKIHKIGNVERKPPKEQLKNNVLQETDGLECSRDRIPEWARVNELESRGKYQKVQHRNIFVYSSYFDNRTVGRRIIKIMGIAMEGEEVVFCQMAYSSNLWISVKANVSVFNLMLPEMHNGFKYRPYFIICPEKTGRVPLYVGISSQVCSSPTNVLQIKWNKTSEKRNTSTIKPKILVCMKTLFDSLIPQRLIEFVEWQRILKVDKIILYDTDNITPDMNRTVYHYVTQGIINIQNYMSPVPDNDLRDRGQLVQINDCLYRNMYKYQYVTFLDPDEMIIPRLHEVSSYSKLINTLNLLNSSAAGYRFPNIIFCLKPSEENRVPPDLLSIRKLVRTDIFPYGTWTKVIANPRRIVEMGIHRIEKALAGFNFPVFVPPSVGTLHHYRRYDFRYCAFKDRTTLRYESEIMKQYKEKIVLLNLK